MKGWIRERGVIILTILLLTDYIEAGRERERWRDVATVLTIAAASGNANG